MCWTKERPPNHFTWMDLYVYINIVSLFSSTTSSSLRQRAAEAVVRGGEVDGERVCVLGGSHGGFLSLHLVAQFPVSPPSPHPAPPPELLSLEEE